MESNRETAVPLGLYRTLLGDRFDQLPRQVQAFHDPQGVTVWGGTAQVKRGANMFARLACHLFGFPETGEDVPLRLTITPLPDGERWDRDFGGRHMVTKQVTRDGWLIEHLGPIRIYMRPVLNGSRFNVSPEKWRFWGLPLPFALMPKSENFETEKAGRLQFNVSIRMPLIGLLISYRGQLECLQPGRFTT